MKKILFMLSLFVCLNDGTFAVTPEDILADDVQESADEKKGIVTRKGSIGALLANVKLLNAELQDMATRQEIQDSFEDIQNDIVNLESIGIFDLFPAEIWLIDENRPGNQLVGILIVQKFPAHLTPEVINRIKELRQSDVNLVRNEAMKVF